MIDLLEPAPDEGSFAARYLAETAEIAQRLDAPTLDAMARRLALVRESGGRLFILGAGGGAGHASHAVNDFRKICDLESYCPSDNVSELTAWVNDAGWDSPMYWRRGDARWELFTLGGWRPVTRAEPVCHVSYYEADAFAHWSGARLPTEFEWESVAAERFPTDGSTSRDSSFGNSLFAQLWQWTSSAYLPYPGFRPAAGAVGEYNGKFMVNQHVLRGGSSATPPGHTRPTYRNFFPAAARWPFTGVRLARDA